MSDNNFSDELSEEIDFDYDEEVASWDESTNSLSESEQSELNFKDDIEEQPIEHTSFFKGKLKKIPYTSWSLDNFVADKLQQCQRLKTYQLPQCEIDEIAAMLCEYNWQEDKVVNSYYDDKQKLGKINKSESSSSLKPSYNFNISCDFTCPICFEEYGKVKTFALSCNHRYCVKCYAKYIDDIWQVGKVVTCPECPLTLSWKIMALVTKNKEIEENVKNTITRKKSDIKESNNINISDSNDNTPHLSNFDQHSSEDQSDSELLDEYSAFFKPIIKRFIETNGNKYKWCPAPDCKLFIEMKHCVAKSKEMNLNNLPIVTCDNGHEFCFACSYENHSPCPCIITEKWIKKCNDDSETANWIQANSQPCTKCGMNIEKAGGCNHMKCENCATEFCWICLGEWVAHTSYYECNKYNPEEHESKLKAIESSKKSLRRYIHYYKRFRIHESSMNGDSRTLQKVEDAMRTFLQERKDKENISWVDIQFLKNAMGPFTTGRKTLKWTYVVGYYLGDSNFAQLFESFQNYLNQSVEELSEILEQIIDKKNKSSITKLVMKNKNQIKSLCGSIYSRQEKIFDFLYTGLNDGLLKFE